MTTQAAGTCGPVCQCPRVQVQVIFMLLGFILYFPKTGRCNPKTLLSPTVPPGFHEARSRPWGWGLGARGRAWTPTGCPSRELAVPGSRGAGPDPHPLGRGAAHAWPLQWSFLRKKHAVSQGPSLRTEAPRPARLRQVLISQAMLSQLVLLRRPAFLLVSPSSPPGLSALGLCPRP